MINYVIMYYDVDKKCEYTYHCEGEDEANCINDFFNNNNTNKKIILGAILQSEYEKGGR